MSYVLNIFQCFLIDRRNSGFPQTSVDMPFHLLKTDPESHLGMFIFSGKDQLRLIDLIFAAYNQRLFQRQFTEKRVTV